MKRLFLTMLCVIGMGVCVTGCGMSQGNSSNEKPSEVIQNTEEVLETEVVEETNSIVGAWKLKGVSVDGVIQVESSYIDAYDYEFIFSEDGNATVTAMGITYETTYEVRKGWITFAEADLASIKLEMDGDYLKMQLNIVGGGLIFERQ